MLRDADDCRSVHFQDKAKEVGMLKEKKKLIKYLDEYIQFLMDHRTDESKQRDHRSAASEKKEILHLITALGRGIREDERARMVRCINDNFVNLPDEWHDGHNKALSVLVISTSVPGYFEVR